MGCSGSSMDIYEPNRFRDKTLIWLLGGGPGSPKPQVAQFLIDRFKFKLISAFDLVRFEEKTGSPEGAEVKKCIEQKQQFPPDLIVRILKRVFSLYGPRKYLLEGFPRSESDIKELTTLFSKYPGVELLGYINLNLTELQMKDRGMKALREVKKEESEQIVEKQVRTIIEGYRNKIRPVHEYYQSTTSFINLQLMNDDVYQMNLRLEEELNKQDLSPVMNVPVHFVQGNDHQQITNFATKLAKKFGILAWSVQELLEEAATKPDFKKETQKHLDQVHESFLANLIARKIEKYNFKGQYLFWGYPRKEDDIKALRVRFIREIQFGSFSCCLHTPTTQKEQAQFQKLHDYFKEYQQVPTLMVTAGDQAYSQIEAHVAKKVKQTKGSGKLVVIPSLGDEGSNSILTKMTPEYEYVEFKQLLKRQIDKDSLYSELIKSNQALNRHLPPPLATNIVFTALREYQQNQAAIKKTQGSQNLQEKPFIVRGYPQNMQQLKSLHSRSPELKVLASIIFEYADKGQKQAVKQHDSIVKSLQLTCDYFQRFSEKTGSEEYKSALTKLTAL